MPGRDADRGEIVGLAVVHLIEHSVARPSRQGFAVGAIKANRGARRCGDHRSGGRHDLARAVRADRHLEGRQRVAGNDAPVEDQLAPPHRHHIAGKADHALDQVGIFGGWRKTTTSPRFGNWASRRPSNARKAEREAVARIAVGPFLNRQIIADVERRQHRPRGDVERRQRRNFSAPMRGKRAPTGTARCPRHSPGVRLAVACGDGPWSASVRLFPRIAGRVKADWQLPFTALCPRPMAKHRQQPAIRTLDELFKAEPDRLSRLSFELSRHLFRLVEDPSRRRHPWKLCRPRGANGVRRGARSAFAGAIVNPSEQRSATHLAERGSGSPEDVELATARRQRMRALVDAIEAGAFGDVTGVLHIGIGGSVLGPALLTDSLGRRSGSFTSASCPTSTAPRSTKP